MRLGTSMTMMTTVGTACFLAACAGGSSSRAGADRRESPARQTVAATPEPAPMIGPRTPTDLELDAATAETVAPPIAAAPVAQEAPARPAPSSSAAREDGRPHWWFSGAEAGAAGAVRICAEALGSDMVEARRAALEAGRGRLRSEMGLSMAESVPGEIVERAWVWPLPNSRVGPSRYAAYVLIAAHATGAD